MKQNYQQHLTSKLNAYYAQVKNNNDAPTQKGEITELMEVGLLTELITRQELQHQIEQCHVNSIGNNLSQRYQTQTNPDSEAFDWAYFDKPKWEH